MTRDQRVKLIDRRVAGSTPARFTRREALRRAGIAAVGAGLLPFGQRGAAAHNEPDPAADPLAGVELPPDLGQTDRHLYVEATGHTLRGIFLDYWRATGAAAIYGNPISEPFAGANGYYSQAFENAVFQYRPEVLYTEEPIVRLMPIGQNPPPSRPDSLRVDGRRTAGGGNPHGGAWRPLDPGSRAVARIVTKGGIFVEATGHTIGPDVLPWYTMNEGEFYIGHPLTQPYTERGRTVQYFEGGLLVIGDDGLRLAPLAAELAPRLGIDTSPVARGDLPVYDEALFRAAATPATPDALAAAGQAGSDYLQIVGDIRAPGMRWIEVSIGEQRLWAYQGDTLVLTTLVSTGLDPNLTELGLFHIRLKYPLQDLSGFTNDTGEVIGFGEAPPGTIPYAVEDVPNVMYFNLDGEALHGTYWHNNFGQKMSHGCVNLPLEVAAWMYGWAPLGTQVWVHE